MNGIVQPEGIKHTSLLHSKAIDLMNTIKGEMKQCVKKCNLDTNTLTCTGCKRTIEEIRQAGIAAKAANNKGETND